MVGIIDIKGKELSAGSDTNRLKNSLFKIWLRFEIRIIAIEGYMCIMMFWLMHRNSLTLNRKLIR